MIASGYNVISVKKCKSNSLTGIRTDHIHKNIHYISRVCAGSSAHALIILHYSLSNV